MLKKYLPLLIVEAYLIATLLIFEFGPIQYRLHNAEAFYGLMVIYHLFFIVGYTLSCLLQTYEGNEVVETQFSKSLYWILFYFGLLGIWSGYISAMVTEEIIPYNFIDDLIRGFKEPGVVYVERMQRLEEGLNSSLRIFNVALIFFGFAKLLFIFYFLFFWSNLNSSKKLNAFFYSFLFISTGISAGLNSIVFVFFIFSAISILVILYDRQYVHFRKVLILGGFLFIIPITWFGKIMSERGGGFEYFSSTSPLGDINVISNFELSAASSFIDFLYYSFVWLCYYVCQGYYGFSLILDLDFKWTYGFGNSEFLQRQLLVVSGLDVSPLTFQSRIDDYWDKSVQWHSFYGQFANDVGFVGLTILLFSIGFFFAKVWQSVLYQKNFFGLALMPIFVIMFVFFPANNQVFGYIDTLSYFLCVTVLWLFKSKKLRRQIDV